MRLVFEEHTGKGGYQSIEEEEMQQVRAEADDAERGPDERRERVEDQEGDREARAHEGGRRRRADAQALARRRRRALGEADAEREEHDEAEGLHVSERGLGGGIVGAGVRASAEALLRPKIARCLFNGFHLSFGLRNRPLLGGASGVPRPLSVLFFPQSCGSLGEVWRRKALRGLSRCRGRRANLRGRRDWRARRGCWARRGLRQRLVAIVVPGGLGSERVDAVGELERNGRRVAVVPAPSVGVVVLVKVQADVRHQHELPVKGRRGRARGAVEALPHQRVREDIRFLLRSRLGPVGQVAHVQLQPVQRGVDEVSLVADRAVILGLDGVHARNLFLELGLLVSDGNRVARHLREPARGA